MFVGVTVCVGVTVGVIVTLGVGVAVSVTVGVGVGVVAHGLYVIQSAQSTNYEYGGIGIVVL